MKNTVFIGFAVVAVFTIAVLVLLLLTNNNTEIQTIFLTPAVTTIFAVSMGGDNSNTVIWQNNTQTNQTFFMNGTLNNQWTVVEHILHRGLKKPFPFPFEWKFVVNGHHTFVVPVTGGHNLCDSMRVRGAIRSNFYFGPIQFIQFTEVIIGNLSQWELYSLNMTSQLDDFMIKTYSNLFVS